ncbi:hypothetical protein GEMRC1_000431 [Eukaryota sp. GEM-RC1]
MDKDEETALASIVRQKNEAADKLTAGSLFLNKMELQVALKHYNLFRGAKTKVTASSGDRLSTTCLDAQCSFKLTSTSQRPGRHTMSRIGEVSLQSEPVFPSYMPWIPFYYQSKCMSLIHLQKPCGPNQDSSKFFLFNSRHNA